MKRAWATFPWVRGIGLPGRISFSFEPDFFTMKMIVMMVMMMITMMMVMMITMMMETFYLSVIICWTFGLTNYHFLIISLAISYLSICSFGLIKCFCANTCLHIRGKKNEILPRGIIIITITKKTREKQPPGGGGVFQICSTNNQTYHNGARIMMDDDDDHCISAWQIQSPW